MREKEVGNGKAVHEDEEAVETKLAKAGVIVAPDGGYGWVIVIASFLANAFVDGIIFTTGQSLLGLWQADFNSSAMAASWAQSLLGGCYLLAGPIAGAMANQFGCRIVTIAGTVLASAGFLLSAFVPALPLLYITFGIIGGIGFGLVYLPAIVIVNQYFEKRRALALGFAVCGSGIGTTVFSQILPLLLRLTNDNWRTCLMCVAAIVLLCIFCGILYRSPQPNEQQVEEVAKIATAFHEAQEEAMQSTRTNQAKSEDAAEAETTKSPHVAKGVAIERFPSERGYAPSSLAERPFLSTIELSFAQANEKNVWTQSDIAKRLSRESLTALNRPLLKKDIFYHGSTTKIRQRSHSYGEKTPAVDDRPLRRLSPSTGQAQTQKASTAAAPSGGLKDALKESFRSMLDVSLLTSPSFIILAISGFLTLCCLFVPFIFIGGAASQIGATKEQESYLLLALGIINIIGRVLCGIVSDLPSVDPLVVSNVGLIMGGVATFCVPLFTQYWMFLAYTVPFAFAVAVFAALRSVICVELLGIEKLSNAFGILLLFMGVAALVGPPFAAVLKDITGNFDLSFYVMGTLMALSGLICVPLRRVSAMEERWRARKEEGTAAELEPLQKTT